MADTADAVRAEAARLGLTSIAAEAQPAQRYSSHNLVGAERFGPAELKMLLALHADDLGKAKSTAAGLGEPAPPELTPKGKSGSQSSTVCSSSGGSTDSGRLPAAALPAAPAAAPPPAAPTSASTSASASVRLILRANETLTRQRERERSLQPAEWAWEHAALVALPVGGLGSAASRALLRSEASSHHKRRRLEAADELQVAAEVGTELLALCAQLREHAEPKPWEALPTADWCELRACGLRSLGAARQPVLDMVLDAPLGGARDERGDDTLPRAKLSLWRPLFFALCRHLPAATETKPQHEQASGVGGLR